MHLTSPICRSVGLSVCLGISAICQAKYLGTRVELLSGLAEAMLPVLLRVYTTPTLADRRVEKVNKMCREIQIGLRMCMCVAKLEVFMSRGRKETDRYSIVVKG